LTDWLDHLKEAGAKGGKKRAANLSPEERGAIAKKAALARWGKKKKVAKVRSAKAKAKKA
jgi:hypothetical protein